MKQIKTIKINLLDNYAFDDEVNTALAEGWTLVKRDIIRPSCNSIEEIDYTALYAELERDFEDPKPEMDHDTIQKMIEHIDDSLDPSREQYWIGDAFVRSNTEPEMEYVRDWWIRCMKPNLLAMKKLLDAQEVPKT